VSTGQLGLKQRRTRFIKEYLIDQNATRAAIAAGYSEKGARVKGSRLLTDANIRSQIEEANAKLNNKLELTAERVKLEIARLAYYDPRAFFRADGAAIPITEIDEDSARAIAGFEMAELFQGNGEERGLAGYVKKFKLADKGRALETAARVLKLLVDRVEVSDADELIARIAAGRKRNAEQGSLTGGSK
jgi:phage terminase small subunit